MENPSACDYECNKACKVDKYLNTKNCSNKKGVLGKLLLSYGDKILNTNETLFNDEKVACAKSNCLVYFI